LNSFSAASSYQEWFLVKARASKQDQACIFYNTQTPQLIIVTSIYSEEAFIRGNMVYRGSSDSPAKARSLLSTLYSKELSIAPYAIAINQTATQL